MEIESTNPIFTQSLNASRRQPNFDETLCPICRFKSEKPLKIHYGGQACFSCRAFFRYVLCMYMNNRYTKEIMKMEQHFSTLQRWLQKKK